MSAWKRKYRKQQAAENRKIARDMRATAKAAASALRAASAMKCGPARTKRLKRGFQLATEVSSVSWNGDLKTARAGKKVSVALLKRQRALKRRCAK